MADIRQVPGVPTTDDPILRNFLSAVREAVNNMSVAVTAAANSTGVTVASVGALSDAINNLLDSTTPPQPSGFTINGLFNTIFINWDNPQYNNYNIAEIWRAPAIDGAGTLLEASTVSLSTAVIVGTSNGEIYVDPVDPHSQYYYWVRFVSNAGIYGPWNSTLGTLGSATQDVDTMMNNNGWTLSSARIQSLAVEKLYSVGAWIATAAILDGNITNAKIGNTIQSDNYNGTNTGWNLNKSAGITSFGAPSGNGMIITTDVIKILSGGVVRVKLGNLNA